MLIKFPQPIQFTLSVLFSLITSSVLDSIYYKESVMPKTKKGIKNKIEKQHLVRLEDEEAAT